MRIKSIIDPEYIAYIKTLPCLICGHYPKGTRKVYFESIDKFKEYPCSNTAHHVDTTQTRRHNDHRVVPLCSHYSVSGIGTNDCHRIEHSNTLKSPERDTWLIEQADDYYNFYIEQKELKCL